VDVTINIHNP